MNFSQPAGTPTARLIEAESMFVHVIGVVFHLLLWYVNGKMSEKRGIVLKPVGRRRGRGASG